jgi:hypothetical protein
MAISFVLCSQQEANQRQIRGFKLSPRQSALDLRSAQDWRKACGTDHGTARYFCLECLLLVNEGERRKP